MAYDSAAVLEACLVGARRELVALGLPHELCVADNGSADDSLAIARRVADEVVAVGANIGFGPAVNLLAQGGSWDWLVVLNPDCVVPPGGWRGLARLVPGGPPALARVRILDTAGRPGRNPEPFPTPLTEGLKYLVGRHRARLTVVARHEARNPLGPGYLQGALLVCNRAAWDAVGGFDERYFLYSEEVDLARRAWALGARLVPADDVEVVHAGTDGEEGKSPAAYVLLHESKWRFMADAYGPRAAHAVRTAAIVGLGVRWVRNAVLSWSPPRRALRRKYARALRAALLFRVVPRPPVPAAAAGARRA